MMMKRLVILCILLGGLPGSYVAAEVACDSQYKIDQTMPNGSRWDMCWTHDNNQGIRYHHIHYTPKNKPRRMVLFDASVAQIHVPYDDNGARYHDVSDFGLGGNYLLSLPPSDCLGGARAYYNGKAVLCRKLMSAGTALRYKDYREEQNVLKVWSVSRVGEYLYSSEWRFYADGRIVPSIVATGALQRFADSSKAQYGWLIADRAENRVGLSHMHNFYWRLDFDLNGSAKNDQVKELNYSVYAGKRYHQISQFSTETSRSVDPSKMRSWIVQDADTTNRKGHPIAYEIRLLESGQREIGPSFEPFTANDFYVTQSKACEKIASHNKRVYACAADNLQEFVNGESIEGEDIVTWVGVSFYHMPRSEDVPYMDAHVSQFELRPRNWHTVNPLLSDTPPTNLKLSAIDDHAVAYEDRAVIIDVLGNDTGNNIHFNSLDNPNHGTARVVDNKVRYVADTGFRGTDVFWYSIKDDNGGVFGARVHVTVTNPRVTTTQGGVNTGGGGAFRWFELLAFIVIAAGLQHCLRRSLANNGSTGIHCAVD